MDNERTLDTPEKNTGDNQPEDRNDGGPCECGGHFWFINYCGAMVCDQCEQHKKLARCYCGWSQSGGNGRMELEEMGETIEADY